MLTDDNPCGRLSTPSGLHYISAHTDRICIASEGIWNRGNYTHAAMWMPPEELRDLVRIAELALAEIAAYQAAQGMVVP